MTLINYQWFTTFPFWFQVWHVPPHWLSLDTGRNIGNIMSSVKDIMVMDSGGKDVRYISVLVDINLTQQVLRGKKLRYKKAEA